jgi:hypothetical protein
MATSAFQGRVLGALGCLLVLGLPVVAWPRDDDKPKADATKRPALYDPKADARVQVEKAVDKARRGHSRVLVTFGFQTCKWCHRLHDLFEQDPEIRQLLRDGYVEVLVDFKSPHAAELMMKCQGFRNSLLGRARRRRQRRHRRVDRTAGAREGVRPGPGQGVPPPLGRSVAGHG